MNEKMRMVKKTADEFGNSLVQCAAVVYLAKELNSATRNVVRKIDRSFTKMKENKKNKKNTHKEKEGEKREHGKEEA